MRLDNKGPRPALSKGQNRGGVYTRGAYSKPWTSFVTPARPAQLLKQSYRSARRASVRKNRPGRQPWLQGSGPPQAQNLVVSGPWTTRSRCAAANRSSPLGRKSRRIRSNPIGVSRILLRPVFRCRFKYLTAYTQKIAFLLQRPLQPAKWLSWISFRRSVHAEATGTPRRCIPGMTIDPIRKIPDRSGLVDVGAAPTGAPQGRHRSPGVANMPQHRRPMAHCVAEIGSYREAAGKAIF